MPESNFVDYVKILCRSGKGGKGSMHLKHVKYNPNGGPDGGDGGKGGSIILRGNHNYWTLLHLKYERHIFAEHGGNGGRDKCHGRLHGEFLQALYDQRKALAGLKKDVKLVAEPDLQRQALRYMATAKNVEKSGHFIVGKDIPDLTMAHLRGWWYNPNDKSTFMLQFNCKTDCYIYENLRMNVYLTKNKDGDTDTCDMRIRFLDLDDDSFEYWSFDTWLPSYAVLDNTVLDYLLEELTLDVDVLDPENVDLVVLLNGTMSFHRSRRIENNNDQPLIEFV